MEYWLHLLILVGIFGLLSVSLNLIAGYAGLLSLAHAAFFGLGAYTAAVVGIRLHAPLLVMLPASMTVCAAAGLLVGLPAFRTHDDTFVIVTFAVQMVFFGLCNNLVALTGGPSGIPGIPRAEIHGLSVASHGPFLFLTMSVLALAFWVVSKVIHSGFGRILCAIREDETAAAAAGKNVLFAKLAVFVLASAMAGAAGALYALYLSFIDPTSFTVMESIFVISAVIVGGAGSLWGPFLGMAVLIFVPEALRFIGLPNGLAANLRQIIYGGLIVVFMLWRPHGLLGRYAFERTRGTP
jgi:branched-chain amino acid transport system permease protein